MLRSMGSQRAGYDWVTELNWIEQAHLVMILIHTGKQNSLKIGLPLEKIRNTAVIKLFFSLFFLPQWTHYHFLFIAPPRTPRPAEYLFCKGLNCKSEGLGLNQGSVVKSPGDTVLRKLSELLVDICKMQMTMPTSWGWHCLRIIRRDMM